MYFEFHCAFVVAGVHMRSIAVCVGCTDSVECGMVYYYLACDNFLLLSC